MNIVVLVKNLTSGGAEKQSILLAKSLRDDYIVHYLVFNAKYQDAKYLKILNENPKIKYHIFGGNILFRFVSFCKYLRKNNIRIIFSYLTAANLIAVIGSKIAGVNFVFTGIRNAYLPPAKEYIDRVLTNKLATATVLNCYSGELHFKKNGFDESKLTVIPNCFENIAEYKKKISNNEKIQIITVGRFVAQKDYATALKAIRQIYIQCNNIYFRIVGFGELEAEIRSLIVQLELDNVVEISINPNNIADLLAESDIYLSTSLFEGTSNSIMEAMNADLPIVATNVGDNYKLIADNRNGYLTPIGNVDKIASSLLKLIKDRDLRLEFGMYSKNHLIESYSLNQFRKSYINLIESLL